jgi:predicted HD phosphohydrolase
MISPPTTADELIALLVCDEDLDRVDEPAEVLSALDHHLQCAAVLAAERPDDVELQVAGLVHDVGHLAVPDDPDAHGRAGADLVRPLLGARVADLVELHVPAKRYLVTVDPTYRARLSANSTWTLGQQGGDLSADERAAFEAHPRADDALALRRADEAAKVAGLVVDGLETWRPALERLAQERRDDA